ncbi:thioredoxin family protein [Pseudoalteromonas sp. MMG005]|uniref:thioredoxin family protein n=1 Tax=Pseudoalteromonas sp. MMG005 TaxID=2822682 RepID=UPI001B3A4A5B|nr:thioredoxin family protein [Pseudoalteromonas sp. MMG005]MBQ4847175.1 thioredoxin family protein [Pseudoalteromonas sp. MMG005]
MNKPLLWFLFNILMICNIKITEAQTAMAHEEVVFIDIWSEYAALSNLPKSHLPRRYFQIDMNVNTADLAHFIQAYPQFKTLKIDKNNRLAKHFSVQKTPTVISLKQGEVVNTYTPNTLVSLPNKEHLVITAEQLRLTSLQNSHFDFNQSDKHPTRLLFFSDALCPKHHLPDCVEKIKAHNQLDLNSKIEKLTIIKPFYVSIADTHTYKQQFYITHPVIFDKHNVLFRQFSVSELPYWILLNNQGSVMYRGNTPPSKTLLHTPHYSNTHSD